MAKGCFELPRDPFQFFFTVSVAISPLLDRSSFDLPFFVVEPRSLVVLKSMDLGSNRARRQQMKVFKTYIYLSIHAIYTIDIFYFKEVLLLVETKITAYLGTPAAVGQATPIFLRTKLKAR